jgi:uncharacterized membrane protein YdjX (TVP38/TMEM64 family)
VAARVGLAVSRFSHRWRAVARLALLGLVIAAAFAAVTLSGVSPADARHWVAGAGALGPLLFVLVAAVLGLALFPGQVIATAAGALFGALTGVPVVLLAALLAAGIALLVARRIGAEALLALLSPRARGWQHWLAEHGFSAVLASRLAPGVPAGLVNYLAGVTGLRVRAVLGAVALGALPKTVAYVALGGALTDPFSARGLVAVALYAAAAAGGVLVVRRLVKSRPQLARA